MKESAGDDIISAVRTVYRGQIFLCKEISERVVHDYILSRDRTEEQGPLEVRHSARPDVR